MIQFELDYRFKVTIKPSNRSRYYDWVLYDSHTDEAFGSRTPCLGQHQALIEAANQLNVLV